MELGKVREGETARGGFLSLRNKLANYTISWNDIVQSNFHF